MEDSRLKTQLNTRPLLLDQNEEEIMLPIPSASQDLLWDELYTIVSDKDLMREVNWFEAPDEIRKYLASIETSTKIDKIGVSFDLGYGQISALAKNIKYVFIKEVLLKDFISVIIKDLKIENKIADRVTQEVKSQIFVPMREYLLKIYPPVSQENNQARKQESNETVKQENIKSPEQENKKTIIESHASVFVPMKTVYTTIMPVASVIPAIRVIPVTPVISVIPTIIATPVIPVIRVTPVIPKISVIHNTPAITAPDRSRGQAPTGIHAIKNNLIVPVEKMHSDMNVSKFPAFKKSEFTVSPITEKKVSQEEEIKPEQFKSVSDTHIQGMSLDHFYEKLRQGNETIKQADNKTNDQNDKKEDLPITWHSNYSLGYQAKSQQNPIREVKNIKPQLHAPTLTVIPVQTGIQITSNLDPRLRGDDKETNKTIKQDDVKILKKEESKPNDEQEKKLAEQLSKMPIRTMRDDISISSKS